MQAALHLTHKQRSPCLGHTNHRRQTFHSRKYFLMIFKSVYADQSQPIDICSPTWPVNRILIALALIYRIPACKLEQILILRECGYSNKSHFHFASTSNIISLNDIRLVGLGEQPIHLLLKASTYLQQCPPYLNHLLKAVLCLHVQQEIPYSY